MHVFFLKDFFDLESLMDNGSEKDYAIILQKKKKKIFVIRYACLQILIPWILFSISAFQISEERPSAHKKNR